MSETRPHSSLLAMAGGGLTGGLWAGLVVLGGEAGWLASHGGGADWPLLLRGSVLVRGVLFALAGIPIGAGLYAFKRHDGVCSAFAAAFGILAAAAVLWLGPGLLRQGMLEGNPLGLPHYAMLTLCALAVGFVLALDAAWLLKRLPSKAVVVAFGIGVAAMAVLGFGLAQPVGSENTKPAIESSSSSPAPQEMSP